MENIGYMSELETRLHNDVMKFMKEFIGSDYAQSADAYWNKDGYNLIYDIEDNVMMNSGFWEGGYNVDDIRLAVGRALLTLIGHPEFA